MHNKDSKVKSDTTNHITTKDNSGVCATEEC